jgi:hypothetical protein
MRAQECFHLWKIKFLTLADSNRVVFGSHKASPTFIIRLRRGVIHHALAARRSARKACSAKAYSAKAYSAKGVQRKGVQRKGVQRKGVQRKHGCDESHPYGAEPEITGFGR